MAGYIGSKSSVTLVDGYTEAEADAEFVNDPNDVITVSGSNVGIGTSSPSAKLDVGGVIQFLDDNTPEIKIIDPDDSNYALIGYSDGTMTLSSNHGNEAGGANVLKMLTGGSERMRLDSSGNLLLGMTSASTNNDGAGIRSDGLIHAKRANVVATFNRKTSDGSIIELAKDNTVVGSIGTSGGRLFIESSGGGNLAGIEFSVIGTSMSPRKNGASSDNEVDVGSATFRWDDVYATNGTIQTSDFNEKQDIASLTATEMLVGKRISVLFKTFRWKDSVAENGDNARTHTGVIAQDVQAAFTAEGLDAGDYALFISSTWWEHDVDVPAVEAVAEVLDEDGNVTTEAVEAKDAYTRTDTYDTEAEAPEGATSKTRMGIRYPELLSFVAAYNEQRFASIEARLTALEA